MIIGLIVLTLIMLTAIVLGLAEIFLFPGITIAGIGGVLFAGGGLYYAYSLSPMVGHITVLASAILFVIGMVWCIRSRSLNKLALQTNVDSRLESSQDLGIQVGDQGKTLSRLAPIGKAQFGDKTVEAQSEVGFIDENTPVTVVRITGYNVVVRPQ